MGVLDTPQGLVAFEGAKENFAHVNLTVGSRIAIFGDEEVSWSLPLGPTLLITPNPDNLDTIKSVLEKQNGERPTILLFGEAYHLLPKMYWVRDPEEIKRRLQEEQVVYTWLDPWKENV